MIFKWLFEATKDPEVTRRMSEFDRGAEAAKEGKEIWENPHASPAGGRVNFDYWLAGWCQGKQLMNGDYESAGERSDTTRGEE